MSKDEYDAGLAVRYRMFGRSVTDEQIQAAGMITRPIQDLVTEQCFGGTWSRPGLDLKTRSLLTVAILIAMGRSHELKIHLKGAVANGADATEIRELIRHAAIYCGLPPAAEAAYVSEAVLAELGVEMEEPGHD
ncbi:carboxymuconolactone decarboxylase family protein [Alloalcanivorax sp. C16-1]|uniref:carboxymuconolactone decarboxylase family protein n=1 Tax=Alloalcanivorax sp. C16-1 TaxID=3390051 RepID=UPI0039709AEF